MASVIKIGDKWRAQVRRKDHKPQTKTFRTKREADEWARGLESRIDADAEPKAAALLKVADMIREYRQVREESGRGIDPTTNTSYMLNHLHEDLGHESVTALTPARLVQWASRRKAEGAGPWTVNQELSALGTMLRHAASFANLQLPDVTGQARPLLTHLQLIGAGARRTRRPTEDELQAVLAYVEARSKPTADAMRVAAVTGLRRSELVLKLKWGEIDAGRRAVLIRQRKHPRRIEARDEWVYPAMNFYCWGTLAGLCAEAGLHCRKLDWPHPEWTWFVVAIDLRRLDASVTPRIFPVASDLVSAGH